MRPAVRHLRAGLASRGFAAGLATIFLLGMCQRLLQLTLLWPALSQHELRQTGARVIQILPAEILRNHVWWGLWYLQGSPPLPNVIFGAIEFLTKSYAVITFLCIMLSGGLSVATSILMALLLRRLSFSRRIAVSLATLFLFSADLIVIEYNADGQYYYEFITMFLCVLACHAALGVIRRQRARYACLLGFCVAALALTRSSFSFFWPVVLLWLLAAGNRRRPRLIAAFLAPVLLLHGGWMVKNGVVHGDWSMSTSSWAGANINKAEASRRGRGGFEQWLSAQPRICEPPWQDLTLHPPPIDFLWPTSWPAALHLPEAILADDRASTARRELAAPYDSAAGSAWSRCLFKEYARYLAARPVLVIGESWQSYRIFWAPIRDYGAVFANPLMLDRPVDWDGTDLARSVSGSWHEAGTRYLLRTRPPKAPALQLGDFTPVPILALPVLPSLISALNFAILHSLPLLLILRLCLPRRAPWPRGASFLVLIYAYVAAVSCVAEFGENMRYRLEAEPIIWAISALILQDWALCAKSCWRKVE